MPIQGGISLPDDDQAVFIQQESGAKLMIEREDIKGGSCAEEFHVAGRDSGLVSGDVHHLTAVVGIPDRDAQFGSGYLRLTDRLVDRRGQITGQQLGSHADRAGHDQHQG